jgi:probable phosphoglycerate mutase
MQQCWPAHLWIVRHGESAGNLAGRAANAARSLRMDIDQRDADVGLSPRGQQQADALGRWFAQREPREQPEVVLTSPYVRARQTADRVCDPLPRECVVDERLREKELGVLDRLTDVGLLELLPEQAELRARLGKFYYRPPGGESWCDVILRLRGALDTISLHYAQQRVLIVCHQVVVLCLRYLLEGLDEKRLLAIDAQGPVNNCSVTEYEFNGALGRSGGMALRRYNFMVPLEQEGVATTAETSRSATR